MEKWEQELEAILREHNLDEGSPDWLKLTEELIKVTREVEFPSGSLGQFIDRVFKHASEKNGPLVAAYIGFRIGVAYERYQNADREAVGGE